MSDDIEAAERGFTDFLRGLDTPASKELLQRHPSLCLAKHILMWGLSGSPAVASTPDAKTIDDHAHRTNLLALLPMLLSEVVGVAEGAIAEWLRPSSPWLEPAVLGAEPPRSIGLHRVDLSRPSGIFITNISLGAEELRWSARNPAMRGRPILLRQLDRGPRLLGEGLVSPFQFDGGANDWVLSLSSARESGVLRGRLFVIAATPEGGGEEETECTIVQFADRTLSVVSAASAFEAARAGYFAESAEWFARSTELPVIKCAFLASQVGAQAHLFEKMKKSILKDINDAYLLAPGSSFMESFRSMIRDIHGQLLKELPRDHERQ